MIALVVAGLSIVLLVVLAGGLARSAAEADRRLEALLDGDRYPISHVRVLRLDRDR